MAILRDLKQTVLNGVEDTAKLTKLVAEDVGEKIKHEVRKDAIDGKIEDLKQGYQHMKQSIKDEFK